MSRYTEIATRVCDELLRLQPETATDLGRHDVDDRLDDLSDGGRRELHAALTEAVDALDTVDADALDVEDRVDLEILRNGLDRELLDLDVVRRWERDPLVWLPGDALYLLLARDTTPPADRLRALASRMQQFPDRLAQARATVQRPPRTSVEVAIGRVEGSLAMVRDEVSELLEQEPGLRAEVAAAQAVAETALTEHRDFLAGQLESADGDPRLGAGVFAARLHLVLDSDLSAGAVVAAAEARVAELTARMEELTGGDIRGALDEAGKDAPDDATILDVCRAAYAEAAAWTRERGFVTLPEQLAEVIEMPESRRGGGVAYCDAPGALEEGGVTYFAVAPTPADWPAARVASFYREYNTQLIRNLSVHEAIPGHVLQLDHARRFRGSTPVRHIFASHSFMEGWATWVEGYLVDQGYGGPGLALQYLKVQLRVAINALLDHGMHAGGMTEAEALDLMMRRGFQEEGEAVGKWRRAQLSSCQLSTYFVGMTELDPTLRGLTNFDAALSHGSPPPRHLPALLA